MSRIPKNCLCCYDAWETLYMTQLEYTELLNQALKIQVELNRLIEKK